MIRIAPLAVFLTVLAIGGATSLLLVSADQDAACAQFSPIDAAVLSVVFLILATALAALMYFNIRATESAREVAKLSNKALTEKDLLLQEMKHRIKNSMARVLAISRQTAAVSDSISAFNESFTSRLQAMAAAQDMLTRSSWDQADLRELLHSELKQVLGDNYDGKRLLGPPIILNARATQAIGLAFHELATNALKYGSGNCRSMGIFIRWEVLGQKLAIQWLETGASYADESTPGFGTKLIRVNIEGELSGTFSRTNSDDSLIVNISIPMRSIK